jgi:1-acylglycerone phosphate reductase
MDNQTKYVLITGCSETSLGSSVALEFVTQPHYHVFASALDLQELSRFSSFSSVTPLALDVTSRDSIAAAASKISQQTGGKLDVLVNNAGIWHRGPLFDADIDEVRSIFETNVIAPLAMSKAFADMLVKAKGHILNVGSVTSYSAIVWQGQLVCHFNIIACPPSIHGTRFDFPLYISNYTVSSRPIP